MYISKSSVGHNEAVNVPPAVASVASASVLFGSCASGNVAHGSGSSRTTKSSADLGSTL